MIDKNVDQHKNAEMEKARQYIPKGAKVGNTINKVEDPKEEAKTAEAPKDEL